MAPETVVGNESIGRCAERAERIAIVTIGNVPLTTWFCVAHFGAAFHGEPWPE